MNHLPFQYGSTRNFCGVPDYNGQEFVILGAPVDCATTFRSGTRMGPNAIRDASMMLIDGVHERYPVDLRQHVGDAGDMPLSSGNTSSMLHLVEETIKDWRSSTNIVTLGGDHSITDGILRAQRKTHGKSNIAVVHFDAHCDTWPMHFGELRGHGTWMNYAVGDQLIDPAYTISIGIRSPVDDDAKNFLARHGGTTISARQAMKYTPYVMADIIKAKIGDRPAYLSLDIDCLDPAYAPGTGTPEIGGLSTMWVSEVIEELQSINWIGMDCVEVNPAYDHGQITALAAATFVWQYLSMNIKKIL